MENGTESYNESNCEPYQNSLDDMIYAFGCAPICVVVFILSVMSMYVLSDFRFKENVFVFFKIESFLIMIDSVIGALLPVSKCKTCTISRTLFAKIIYVYFFIYASLILETSSIVVNMLQVYCCIRMLKNLKANIIYNHPYIISIVLIVLFFVLSLNQAFQIIIVQTTDSCGESVYSSTSTDFNDTLFNKIYFVIYATFTNLVLLLALIVMDILLMLQIKANLKQKMNMAKNSKNGRNKVKKSRIKLAKMILIDCLVSSVFHFDLLLGFVIGTVIPVDFGDFPFYSVTTFFLYVCEGLKFVTFYRFNKRFRANFNLKFLKCCIGQKGLQQPPVTTNLDSIETRKR